MRDQRFTSRAEQKFWRAHALTLAAGENGRRSVRESRHGRKRFIAHRLDAPEAFENDYSFSACRAVQSLHGQSERKYSKE